MTGYVSGPRAGDSRPRAFLFSGHGAQTFQMARSIYEMCGEFRASVKCIDAGFQARLGVSVTEYLYDDRRRRSDIFDDFAFSHPAIFMIQYALSRVLADRLGPPAIVLGASLGELVAATVSGAISLDEALDLVAHHVSVLTGPGPRGGMLAILAPHRMYEEWPDVSQRCALVTLVDETHFIVAGTGAELDEVESFLSRNDVDFLRLPVRYPFHSDRIDGFEAGIAACPDWIPRLPRIPVVSCGSHSLVRRYSKEHMWQSLRQPLNIGEGLAVLAKMGALDYLDLGPGSAFAAALGRRVLPSGSRVLRVLTPFGNEFSNFTKVRDGVAVRVGQERPA